MLVIKRESAQSLFISPSNFFLSVLNCRSNISATFLPSTLINPFAITLYANRSLALFTSSCVFMYWLGTKPLTTAVALQLTNIPQSSPSRCFGERWFKQLTFHCRSGLLSALSIWFNRKEQSCSGDVLPLSCLSPIPS